MQASILSAQQTNRPLRVLPNNKQAKPLPWGTTTNLAAPGWSKVKQPRPLDSIGTNTPAFDAWAVPFMLSYANSILNLWKLQCDKPVSTNDTTWYYYPSRLGLCGNIATINRRYVWSFNFGRMDLFMDEDYFARNIAYSDEFGERLSKIKSNISKDEARKIAEDALHALGISPRKSGLRGQPKVTQYLYEWGGKQLPLPLFLVKWEDMEEPDNWPGVEMQVSGIIDRVVSYSNHAPKTPRLPLPTNYFEMLGVSPTNQVKIFRAKTP